MIHALPGMGADRRMYPTPWSSLPKFTAHGWTRYAGEQSLAEVAQSMCETYQIQDGDTLVGASLGGMVACEMTKIRRIPTLFLIGSATEKNGVNRLLAMLHPIARITPFAWFKVIAGQVPMELPQMFARSDPAFVRSMCAAIFRWEGLGASKTQVYRIHGKFDMVIPHPPKVDLLLRGGHLISMTHVKECSDFVRTRFLDGAN